MRNGAALDVTFEKTLRAKLHKNVQYFDEWRAEQRLASASQRWCGRHICPEASRIVMLPRGLHQRVAGCKPMTQPRVPAREGSERERARSMCLRTIQAFAWAWGCARAASVSTM